jgi:hypothetical protein
VNPTWQLRATSADSHLGTSNSYLRITVSLCFWDLWDVFSLFMYVRVISVVLALWSTSKLYSSCIFFSSAKSCIPWIRGWTFVAAQREWTGDRSLSRLSWKISGRSQQGLRCTDINRIHGDSMPQNLVYFSESKLNDGEFPMSHAVHAVAWLHSLWSSCICHLLNRSL